MKYTQDLLKSGTSKAHHRRQQRVGGDLAAGLDEKIEEGRVHRRVQNLIDDDTPKCLLCLCSA
jgi:hypothetical protein